MPLALLGFILGAIWGTLRAKSRKGSRADIVQWALVHGLILAMIGLFTALILVRSTG